MLLGSDITSQSDIQKKGEAARERAGNDLNAFHFHKGAECIWEPSASKCVCVCGCAAKSSLSNIKCQSCASTAVGHKIGKRKKKEKKNRHIGEAVFTAVHTLTVTQTE